jgi:hypothetical protein
MELTNKQLYADIKYILEQARSNAIRSVNFSMVAATGKSVNGSWKMNNRVANERTTANQF